MIAAALKSVAQTPVYLTWNVELKLTFGKGTSISRDAREIVAAVSSCVGSAALAWMKTEANVYIQVEADSGVVRDDTLLGNLVCEGLQGIIPRPVVRWIITPAIAE